MIGNVVSVGRWCAAAMILGFLVAGCKSGSSSPASGGSSTSSSSGSSSGSSSSGSGSSSGGSVKCAGSSCAFTTAAGTVTLTTSAGTIGGAQFASAPAAAPHDISTPFGWYTYSITGLSIGATVTLTFTVPAGFNLLSYEKCASGSCAPLPGASISGSTLTITMTDGGTGDADGVANGTIADPGAIVAVSGLNSPQGMVFSGGTLYVANAGANQVLVFSEAINSGLPALTQTAVIASSDMSLPVRLAMDAAGFLYVANRGNNSVTVYDTHNNNAEVTASGGGALISGGGLDGPLGVAVDSNGNVYVANNYPAANADNSISVFAPNGRTPAAGFTPTSSSPLAMDGAQLAFQAPGVLYDQNITNLSIAGVTLNLGEYLVAGLGPTQSPDSIIIYGSKAPTYPLLTNSSVSSYDLIASSGCTMPSGPTGIAAYVDTSGSNLLVDAQSSYIYVTSFYNNSIFQYSFADFYGASFGLSPSACPTPQINGNGVSGPEGVAVDAVGNVFVSMTGAADNITVYPGGTAFVSSAPPIASYNGLPGTPTPALYVIDSTLTLFGFDANGNKLTSTALPAAAAGSIGNLNGGGITVDANNVYVTLGAPSNSVVAFNKFNLQPVSLPSGSFAGLDTPRGIVYDSNNRQFYVGNGGSTVTAYSAAGAPLAISFPSAVYGPSGVAFDPVDRTIWVANYTGGSGVGANYGVAEFNENGSLAQTFNYATQFVAPVNGSRELPYAIGYCVSSGGAPANIVAVGFLSDNSGQGQSEGGGYSSSGIEIGTQFVNTLTNPHAMSCASTGQIYVAADNGLLIYNVTGSEIGPATGAFSALKAPIYGVFAAY